MSIVIRNNYTLSIKYWVEKCLHEETFNMTDVMSNAPAVNIRQNPYYILYLYMDGSVDIQNSTTTYWTNGLAGAVREFGRKSII